MFTINTAYNEQRLSSGGVEVFKDREAYSMYTAVNETALYTVQFCEIWDNKKMFKSCVLLYVPENLTRMLLKMTIMKLKTTADFTSELCFCVRVLVHLQIITETQNQRPNGITAATTPINTFMFWPVTK